MTADQARIEAVQGLGLTPMAAKVVLALYADRDGPLTSDELMDAIGTDSIGTAKTSVANVRSALGLGAIVSVKRRYWMPEPTHERIGKLLKRKGVA